MVSYEEKQIRKSVFFKFMVSYEDNTNLEVIFLEFMVSYEENTNWEAKPSENQSKTMAKAQET